MRNAGLEEAQLELRLLGEISITSDMQMTPSLWQKAKKTLESPLHCKEIQPVYSKTEQFWVFIGRTDVEVETSILWLPHVKSWLIEKDPDAGRDWRQEKKGMTEDEMAGWHHWLDGHEFEWTPDIGVGQRGLVCCDSWGRKESDITEWLNWTELNWYFKYLTVFSINSVSKNALLASQYSWHLIYICQCLHRKNKNFAVSTENGKMETFPMLKYHLSERINN